MTGGGTIPQVKLDPIEEMLSVKKICFWLTTGV